MSSFRLLMKMPEKDFFDGEVEYFDVPHKEGRYGILANHLKTLIYVDSGICYYKINGEQKNIFTLGGVLYINEDGVVFLSSLVVYEEDAEKALNDREKFASAAKQRMRDSYIEFKRNKVALVSAMKNLAGKSERNLND